MTITRLAILLLCFISVTSCKVSYKKNINPDIGSGSVGDVDDGGVWSTPGVYLNAKVCLEGAVNQAALPGSLEMVYTLNTNLTLPYVTPYTLAAPWFHYSASDIALDPSIYYDGDLSTGWVDWVLVEVYSYNSGYAKVDAQSALLNSDGRLFNTSGQQGLFFSTLLPGDYYINIKHRNHLAIANQVAVSLTVQSPLDFDAAVFELDFTNVLTLTTGDTATVVGNQCMLAGDVNSDNTIDSIIDLGLLNTQVDSIFPSAVHNTTLNGYFSTDTNFDGTIKKDTAVTPSTPDHSLIITNLSPTTTLVHPYAPAPP